MLSSNVHLWYFELFDLNLISINIGMNNEFYHQYKSNDMIEYWMIWNVWIKMD